MENEKVELEGKGKRITERESCWREVFVDVLVDAFGGGGEGFEREDGHREEEGNKDSVRAKDLMGNQVSQREVVDQKASRKTLILTK